ncbi:MAG: acetolactate synthase small subunit [Lachnospiraceae bacterium]|nr:acetolactate synthase small subunit [Lachnospiraceae bacterium]
MIMESNVRKMVLSIFVDNTFGVLSRVAGLFSRRGYNIDSLTVGTTEDPKYSRMTVVATGDEQILTQIKKQVEKLEDVREVKELVPSSSVYRELILVKIRCKAEQRQAVISISEIFRAKIVDVTPDSLTAELTGDQDKLEAFLKLLEDYKILEIARTGITGLSRGR